MTTLAALFAQADAIVDHRSTEDQEAIAAEYAAVLSDIENLASDEDKDDQETDLQTEFFAHEEERSWMYEE
jgi:DNA-binding ferritin-like protein